MERKQSEKVLDFEEFIVSIDFNCVLFTIILLCYVPYNRLNYLEYFESVIMFITLLFCILKLAKSSYLKSLSKPVFRFTKMKCSKREHYPKGSVAVTE